jgi:hypothetical protein
MVVLSFSATTSIPSSRTTKSTTTTTRVNSVMNNHMDKSNNWSMMPDEPAPEVRSKNRSMAYFLVYTFVVICRISFDDMFTYYFFYHNFSPPLVIHIYISLFGNRSIHDVRIPMNRFRRIQCGCR